MWRGPLQPSETSPSYLVEIRLRPPGLPGVRVLSPRLRQDAPHRYGDGTLCLYWPRDWRWQPRSLLYQTIVPWTALWLFYYELWLDTGQWLGPSSHDPRVRKEANN